MAGLPDPGEPLQGAPSLYFPSFPGSPAPPSDQGHAPREKAAQRSRPHASLMVVPWSLWSQSQERCQSPMMLSCPLPTQTPHPCPGLVTLGASEASSSLTRSVPGASWGGDSCSAPPPGRPLLSVTKPGDQGGHHMALPCALNTAHYHFAHCLFTLHMSPRRGWKIKCIDTVMHKG